MSIKYTESHIIEVKCEIRNCKNKASAIRARERHAENELIDMGWLIPIGGDRLYEKGHVLCPKHNGKNKAKEGK